MSKPSRGAVASGKKKAKKRPESRPSAEVSAPVAPREPVQSQESGAGAFAASGPVLQFRPKGREAVAARPAGGKSGATSRSVLQPVDYSYVYTDLKIIGVLVSALLLALVVLSLAVR